MTLNEKSKMQLCIPCVDVHFEKLYCLFWGHIWQTKLAHHNFPISNAIDKQFNFENRSSGTIWIEFVDFAIYLWYFMNIHSNYELAEYGMSLVECKFLVIFRISSSAE